MTDLSANILECAHRAGGDLHLNSKRIIACCDGTWNNTYVLHVPDKTLSPLKRALTKTRIILFSNSLDSGIASNVSRLSGAIAQKCCTGKPQIIYYHPGVGTDESKISKLTGGMFGLGVLSVSPPAFSLIFVFPFVFCG